MSTFIFGLSDKDGTYDSIVTPSGSLDAVPQNPSDHGGCKSCTFHGGKSVGGMLCFDTPYCSASRRADGVEVVWVKRDTALPRQTSANPPALEGTWSFSEGHLRHHATNGCTTSWAIELADNSFIRQALAWNDPNGDFDGLSRIYLLEILLKDFGLSR